MATHPDRLLYTAREIFSVPLPQMWLYDTVIALARWSGTWRYPIDASGEFETMKARDRIYWLYKAQYPVERAVRGSGMEQHFAAQADAAWTLPDGFEPSNEITLSSAGDLMDHPFLGNSQGYLYDRAADAILGADISMANLECVIMPGANAPFVFRPDSAPPLQFGRAQYDAVKGQDGRPYRCLATACNHSLDCGEAGVVSTITTLESDDIAFSGTTRSEDAAAGATVITRHGVSVGIISHTFGLNGKRPPADKPWLVNCTRLNWPFEDIDFTALHHQIDDCRRREVDFVVAHLHWGMEHEYYPRPGQLDVAHALAERGVDLIIGHHPHVIQPMECYRTRRDPRRAVPIFYSLGNLITPFTHPAFRRSGLARLVITKGYLPGDERPRTYVRSASMQSAVMEIDESRRRIQIRVNP